MASIIDKIAQIRQAVFGKDVRESIASGIEAINAEVESTTARQNVIDLNEAERISAENTRIENENTRIEEHTQQTTEVEAIKVAYDAATKANLSVEVSNARTDNINGKTYETLGKRLDDTATSLAEDATRLLDISINVKGLGFLAYGDGIHDDTTAIQKAADNAEGRVLFFPGDSTTVYLVSSSIWIKSKTKVIFAPGVKIKRANNTLIKNNALDENNIFNIGSSKGVRYTGDNSAEWVIFENVEIDGNCENQSTYTVSLENVDGWGINLRYVKNAVMRDCNIHHCFSGGFLSSMVQGLVLDNVECSYNAIQSNFENTGNGFDFNGMQDGTYPELRSHIFAINCKAHHNADEGFVFNAVNDVSIVNCHAWDNGNSTYSPNGVMGFEFTGNKTDVNYVSNIQIDNCSAINNNRLGTVNIGTALRIFTMGDIANIQINNFLAKGHDGYGFDISFNGLNSKGSLQINNLIIDGYGNASSTKHGFLIQRAAGTNISKIAINNVEVKNGFGTGTGFILVSNSSGSMKDVSLNNVIVNGSYDGIAAIGNIDNLTINGKATECKNHGFAIKAMTGYVMNNVALIGCQSINNNRSTTTGDGFYLNPASQGGAINVLVMTACRASGNRNGIATSSCVSKLILDESCNLEGNSLAINSGDTCNRRTSAPTVGTWVVGDKVYNTSPTAGGYLGWVCVTAGTPGIFKGFGLIEA